MNIQIPRIYKDLKLKEREAMMVAFMTLVSHEHGWEHDYNISPWDLAKIMHIPGAVLTSDKMDVLKTIFKFTYLNDENWMIRWINTDVKTLYALSGRGALKTERYKLTTARNISVWCYLLGLYRGSKNLITDSYKLFENEDNNKTMTVLEEDNFRIEDRGVGLNRT